MEMRPVNVHIVWSQGWDNAPPMALRNAAAWEGIGVVHRWSAIDAEKLGIEPAVMAAMPFPAMKADVLLAHAMLKFGGIAVGADMTPIDHEKIKTSLAAAAIAGVGQVVYQSFRDEPYSEASFFPSMHPWIKLVCNQQIINVSGMIEADKVVSRVTGPAMWRSLIRQNYAMWISSVRTIPAWVAFTHEPRMRGRKHAGGWINPGLNGDWLGEKPGAWM